MKQFLIPAFLIAGFWPVWLWFYERLSDRSDEPLGIVAVITLVALPYLSRSKNQKADSPALDKTRWWQLTSLALTAAYSASLFFAPKLVQALLCLLALTSSLTALRIRKFFPGEWMLVALALPVVASLNFYLGYPMRCVVTQLAYTCLRLSGLPVQTQGTSLSIGQDLVEIDAPCSGIKMLWFSTYLAAAISSMFGFNTIRTSCLLIAAGIAALLGNVLRVCSLFYLETDVLHLPALKEHEEFFHQGIGVISFVVVGSILATAAFMIEKVSLKDRETKPTIRRRNSHDERKEPSPSIQEQEQDQEQKTEAGPAPQAGNSPFKTALVTLSAVALLAGFVPRESFSTVTSTEPFPGWPAQFEGVNLEARPNSDMEKEFLSGFPGQMASFDCGARRVILRWITHETRQLHPSSDCLKAQGYEIKWKPLEIQGQTRWCCFEARKADSVIHVKERIYEQSGKSFSDVSAWYWACVMGQTHGPWWSVTVMEAG